MITPEIKDRLAKIYELVNRGATEGERAAAKKALDKMLSKYKLDGIELDTINKNRYRYKYTTELEVMLMLRIVRTLIDDPNAMKEAYRHTRGVKELSMVLTYMDHVTLSASYEYFRRHMKAQWQKVCAPVIKRCRTLASKKAKRIELEKPFFNKYAIASGLYRPHEIESKVIDLNKLSAVERKKRELIGKVEGGKYNRQVTNGLLLGLESEALNG